jgi:uncharacterized membrane protein YGL010W
MKRKYLLLTALFLVILTTAAVYFFTSAKYQIQKDVSVNCMYMGYACGDCYPQYNVSKVLPSSLEKKLLKKDIDIEFANKEQKEQFEKKVGICGICYIYEFKGNLYYSEKKNCFVIKLTDYNLKLKDEKCCEP